MKRRLPLVTATIALLACTFFLWMFFAAATLERTADVGGISASSFQETRTAAYDFAAKWRHGMAGNSPLYMPGFFTAAIAIWFWCGARSLRRMLVEGAVLVALASCCAVVLAPLAAPRIISDFRAQHGFVVTNTATSWTWIPFAQGVYTLLTWATLIITSRWSIRLRSFKPLVVPLVFYIVLALVRPWTVADFTSLWMSQTLASQPAAVVSFLAVPLMASFMAWIELRTPRRKTPALTKRIESL
jgi:hypothetical protein